MPATRISGFGLLWLGLALAYLAASALGNRAAALGVLGLMVGGIVAARGSRLLGLVVGVALAALAWRFAETLRILVFIPPLAAFAFMAIFFGSTLRAGSEPLITRVARKEHPDLPAEMERHARWLTGVWTACFAALFVASLALAPLVPLETWSRWVHGLGYVVPGALFLGEHAYRHHRFAQRTHGSVAVLVTNVLAVMREMALESGRAAAPESRPQ
jgi:uncharacterized membrane protein